MDAALDDFFAQNAPPPIAQEMQELIDNIEQQVNEGPYLEYRADGRFHLRTPPQKSEQPRK